jgi:hypothetical protein
MQTSRVSWYSLASVSISAYLAMSFVVTFQILRLNDGLLVYTFDDAYIHLAMARNWLRAGVIGISPGDFAVATSSPLWTATLTGLSYLAGLREIYPYLINIVSSVALLVLFWLINYKDTTRGLWDGVGCRTRWWYLFAAALPLLSYLPTMTIAGMEHVFHALLTIVFTATLYRSIHVNSGNIRPNFGILCALAFLLPITRLEGIFAVVLGAILLVLHRMPAKALVVFLLGLCPTLMLGLYSLQGGGLFPSNSIAQKAIPVVSQLGWIKQMVSRYSGNLSVDLSILLVIVCASIWVYSSWRSGHREGLKRASYFLGLIVLHLSFSSVGAFERYQAYLIVLALFLVVQEFSNLNFSELVNLARNNASVGCALVCIVVFGFGIRQVNLFLDTPIASNNIYEQQYQMGRFIGAHYGDSAVAVNDIGVVALRANGKVIDLAGLGTSSLAHLARRAGGEKSLTGDVVNPILHRDDVQLIIIYPEWFGEDLYSSWYKVGSWSIGKRLITPAAASVVFYTLDCATYRQALQRLENFEKELPSDVKYRYYPNPSSGCDIAIEGPLVTSVHKPVGDAGGH